MSISRDDVDDMLHREWNNARIDRDRAAKQRLAVRAVDKVLIEFELQGFTGFAVTRDAEGRIEIVGTPEKIPNFDRRQP